MLLFLCTSLWFKDCLPGTSPLPTEEPWPVWTRYPTLSSRHRTWSWDGLWSRWLKYNASFGAFSLVLLEKTQDSLVSLELDDIVRHAIMFISCDESLLPGRVWGWCWWKEKGKREVWWENGKTWGISPCSSRTLWNWWLQYLSYNSISSPASFQCISFHLSRFCLVLPLALKSPD